MHGHVNPAEFLAQMSGFIGSYYLMLAMMNSVAALYLWLSGQAKSLFSLLGLTITTAHAWLLVAMVFTVMSGIALGGGVSVLSFSTAQRDLMDGLMDPKVYTGGVLGILTVMFLLRKFFVKPVVAWSVFNLSLLFMGLSLTDPDFAAIVTKPDNVPIVAMVFLLGFFTWLSAHKAVQNDERTARGEAPLEADTEKVLVWPDLVYSELICMIAITAVLLIWGIALQAPLEEPASSVKTPNPSKAPWYFLGLQEMLVYYDPWMAGVVLPSMVIFGLMAVPYIDYNRAGCGYYTIAQRPFAYVTFQFGFLVLWVTLIVMGTFLRGPNWNIFGIYETWDPHKVEALNNVDLSEFVWIRWLGTGKPEAAEGAGTAAQLIAILIREFPGIVLVLLYFGFAPPAMVLYSKFFRELFLKMGFMRFMVLSNLLLMMGLLPIKMVCRWAFNLKYFIAINEYFLNF